MPNKDLFFNLCQPISKIWVPSPALRHKELDEEGKPCDHSKTFKSNHDILKAEYDAVYNGKQYYRHYIQKRDMV